jgi:hypothetical protein
MDVYVYMHVHVRMCLFINVYVCKWHLYANVRNDDGQCAFIISSRCMAIRILVNAY